MHDMTHGTLPYSGPLETELTGVIGVTDIHLVTVITGFSSDLRQSVGRGGQVESCPMGRLSTVFFKTSLKFSLSA